jgi:hypothetical protein
MELSECQKRERRRFLAWSFGVGICVPAILVVFGLELGPRIHWQPEGLTGAILWVGSFVIWPTWVFMIDAEHASQIFPALLVAASVNGLWYTAIGLLIWHFRHRYAESAAAKASRN